MSWIDRALMVHAPDDYTLQKLAAGVLPIAPVRAKVKDPAAIARAVAKLPAPKAKEAAVWYQYCPDVLLEILKQDHRITIRKHVCANAAAPSWDLIDKLKELEVGTPDRLWELEFMLDGLDCLNSEDGINNLICRLQDALGPWYLVPKVFAEHVARTLVSGGRERVVEILSAIPTRHLREIVHEARRLNLVSLTILIDAVLRRIEIVDDARSGLQDTLRAQIEDCLYDDDRLPFVLAALGENGPRAYLDAAMQTFGLCTVALQSHRVLQVLGVHGFCGLEDWLRERIGPLTPEGVRVLKEERDRGVDLPGKWPGAVTLQGIAELDRLNIPMLYDNVTIDGDHSRQLEDVAAVIGDDQTAPSWVPKLVERLFDYGGSRGSRIESPLSEEAVGVIRRAFSREQGLVRPFNLRQKVGRYLSPEQFRSAISDLPERRPMLEALASRTAREREDWAEQVGPVAAWRELSVSPRNHGSNVSWEDFLPLSDMLARIRKMADGSSQAPSGGMGHMPFVETFTQDPELVDGIASKMVEQEMAAGVVTMHSGTGLANPGCMNTAKVYMHLVRHAQDIPFEGGPAAHQHAVALGRRAADIFGDDLQSWNLLESLLESWEGTAQELFDTVETLS